MKRPATLLAALSGATGLVASCAPIPAEPSAGRGVSFPMSADGWTTEPAILSMGAVPASAQFARYEGMPAGTMTLNEGVAVANAARFSTGTIDFDIKPIGYDDAGIVFHRAGSTDGEFVYLRADPDCPAADDCVQYAPITHTMMAWNVYPNFQGPAPISPTGWNHVRVAVIGDGMRVYVNRSPEPSLLVPRLWGLTREGGIAFKGPAVFANLVVDHRPATTLPAIPAPSIEPGTVTSWLAAPPTAARPGDAVSATDAPPRGSWRPIEAEPTGLVDLGRAYGLARAPSLSIGWLRTEINAAAPTHRTLLVGFAEEVSVFLDGRLVFAGANQYFPPADRLSPDGRLEADNASIPIDLHQGRNEIVLAVGNAWRSQKGPIVPSSYGWAAEAHVDPAYGLDLD